MKKYRLVKDLTKHAREKATKSAITPKIKSMIKKGIITISSHSLPELIRFQEGLR